MQYITPHNSLYKIQTYRWKTRLTLKDGRKDKLPTVILRIKTKDVISVHGKIQKFYHKEKDMGNLFTRFP